MVLKLHKFINLNNKKFSIKIFNQRLPFIYIFFNFLYRNFIINSKTEDKEIKKFHNSGYTKINISLKKEIEKYKEKFLLNVKQLNKGKKKVFFELNDNDKKELSLKIKEKLLPFINKLEQYFNCDVFISYIGVSRNYNHDDALNLDVDHYANHFHQDSYMMTYNKIFINLMDITEDDGPLEIIPRENRDSFVKSFKYNDINNYNLFGNRNLIKKNTGKIGDCFLFSSPQVFHRAGVPKHYRDNMEIILITIPKKYAEGIDKIDDVKLFQDNLNLFQKFTKPYSIVKVIKLFFTFLRYKYSG